MADTGAWLVDRVFPDVPVRQWVLSLPFALRYHLARDPDLCGKVRRIYVRAIFALLRAKAREHGIEGARPGAVVAVQRFEKDPSESRMAHRHEVSIRDHHARSASLAWPGRHDPA
jgi:hypothetical protein